MKRKLKIEEIDNIKKQKVNLEKIISSLRESAISETLAADENHDLLSTKKVAVFIKTLKEKEKILLDLNYIHIKLENQYKNIEWD